MKGKVCRRLTTYARADGSSVQGLWMSNRETGGGLFTESLEIATSRWLSESGESPDISEELGTYDPSLGLSVQSSLLDAGVVGDINRMLNGCWAIVKEG